MTKRFLKQPVKICPYNKEWKLQFEKEKGLLIESIDKEVLVAHIGSTAVTNMPAKPIIDIMIGFNSKKDILSEIPNIEKSGYIYDKNFEKIIPERKFFYKFNEKEVISHQIHSTIYKNKFWNDRIAFRDILEVHKDVAKKYLDLKMKLEKKYKYKRTEYSEGKSDFIAKVLKRYKG